MSRIRKSDSDAMEDFKKAHSLPGQVRIRFIGVWDTVDAVGGPFHSSDFINAVFHRFKFPDHKLSDKIDCAAQALSIDDARAAFEPVLWEAEPQVEQVWFAGVHSNVGGGYPKQGMSLVTLDWMMQKARACGLRLLSDDREVLLGTRRTSTIKCTTRAPDWECSTAGSLATCRNCAKSRRPRCRPPSTSVCSNESRMVPTATPQAPWPLERRWCLHGQQCR